MLGRGLGHLASPFRSAFLYQCPSFSPYIRLTSLPLRAYNSTMAAAGDFVKGRVFSNGVAVITLDRPKALNAMDLDMDVRYKKFLEEWESDPDVKCILVESSSPRAFCAGMDIKGVVAEIRKDKTSTLVEKVFKAEYSLICKIKEYKKPYISLMDGITMGFGIGLSCHGEYRIITETTLLAMPENGIGLFPDVGFAFIAAQTPGGGSLGKYMAMTGKRISGPEDCLYSGLGTHYVPSINLPSLKQSLLQTVFSEDIGQDVKKLLERYGSLPASESGLRRLLPQISSTFETGKSVEEMIADLSRHELSTDDAVSGWATEAKAGMERGGPFSLCLTEEHFSRVASARVREDGDLSKLGGVMKAEFRIALRSSRRHDFVEGVRAVLLDKDQKPKWKPGKLEEVNKREVEEAFGALSPDIGELVL